jgi:PHD/YefM family antitoxin component YafN of YafNO toxin-antitoxin module
MMGCGPDGSPRIPAMEFEPALFWFSFSHHSDGVRGMSTRGLLAFRLEGLEDITYNHPDSCPRVLGRGTIRALSIATARKALLHLPEVVQDGPILVMKGGHPVMAILSKEHFEGMLETLEILGNQDFCRRLRKSIEQAKAPVTISLDGAQAK